MWGVFSSFKLGFKFVSVVINVNTLLRTFQPSRELCDKRIVLFQEWFIELSADKKDLFSLSFTARPFSATITVQVYHVTPAFINHRKDSFLVKSAELKRTFMQKKKTNPPTPKPTHFTHILPLSQNRADPNQSRKTSGGPQCKTDEEDKHIRCRTGLQEEVSLNSSAVV